MSSSQSAFAATAAALRPAGRTRTLTRVRIWPEPLVLALLAGLLNFWELSRNGWANTYYAGAVRSMSASWHNFLFAAFDPSGVMSVDKPPLALWVQTLSVEIFGFHPLALLAPQALMGIASVLLVYDLTRRRFGRAAGFAAGLVLALTPIAVAISRHNNPDALLVLCSVAALWCALRALEDGRTRWFVLAGICVGLGFETKMLIALVVVPGIAAAWLWADAPRGFARRLRQLLAGGLALLLVAGAWPALVELVPAGSRPWVSGTADNRALSLIFGYNGLERLEAGHAGGPQALGGSNLFGGSAGPLRLLDEALGGQAGWLLGFALLSAAAILLACRLRRGDPRSAWLLAVGGSFLTTAVVLSFAGGIFHPYYVSLLAPFSAALVGAGTAQLLRGGRQMRVLAALALAAGVATELAVLHDYPRELRWLTPALIVCGALAVALLLLSASRLRRATLTAMFAVLLIAPATWAVETLGHATNGTFPAGGPTQNPAGAFAGPGGRGGAPFAGPGGRGAPFAAARAGAPVPFVGPPPGVPAPSAGAAVAGGPEAATAGPRGARGEAVLNGRLATPGSGSGGSLAPGIAGHNGAGIGAPGFGGQDRSLTQAVRYAQAHGGGTVAVASQSEAATLVTAGADVAGIGGFSGRESETSAAWLAGEVAAGRIRWVLTTSRGPGGAPGGRDRRVGATRALSAAAQNCRRVSALSGLYDCAGDAARLRAAALR
jgi:4-amino-4-deoxy-L-arabinose transferase-like glycosyltransferase